MFAKFITGRKAATLCGCAVAIASSFGLAGAAYAGTANPDTMTLTWVASGYPTLAPQPIYAGDIGFPGFWEGCINVKNNDVFPGNVTSVTMTGTGVGVYGSWTAGGVVCVQVSNNYGTSHSSTSGTYTTTAGGSAGITVHW